MPRHIARWDLDKTYLRTEFDSFRDLVRTAFERPDEKRTNPGAATLLREMVRGGISVHILSGSPEQMRTRLEDKLRLDGIRWDSFTLKPNLKNMLRLRFRALRDQLGYKLPALLLARLQATPSPDGVRQETLFGDDAEADAFVYSLYADVLAGRVSEEILIRVCKAGRVYDDVLAHVLQYARLLANTPVVERILIHLEGQSPPDDFGIYGRRVVPFYNYLQAALVVFEDGRISAESVLRVAVEMVVAQRFGGDALVRSYRDLARRGHLRGIGVSALCEAFDGMTERERLPGVGELRHFLTELPKMGETFSPGVAQEAQEAQEAQAAPDYVALVGSHNRRRRTRT